MARLLQQNPHAQHAFSEHLRQKIDHQKQAVKEHTKTSIPLLGKLLAPFVGFAFDYDQRVQETKGSRGEHRVVDACLRQLPESWIVMPNVVIMPSETTFAQIDVLLIGPAGMFLVETKAWEGSFLAHRNEWKRREGKRWVVCHSPTHQAERHGYVVQQWLQQLPFKNFPEPITLWLQPLVVFTRAQWVKVQGSRTPVFMGVQELIRHILLQPINRLDAFQIGWLSQQCASPLPPNAVPREPTLQPSVPLCPQCGIPMVLRRKKHGFSQDKPFYGCSNFPRCRAIVPCS